jgi:hypothetical protein
MGIYIYEPSIMYAPIDFMNLKPKNQSLGLVHHPPIRGYLPIALGYPLVLNALK